MTRALLLGFAVLAVTTVGCSKTDRTKPAGSEQPPGSTAAVGTSGSDTGGKIDEDFVRDVAFMNMTEIELSRVALARATRPDVKLFARQMIDDHGAAGEKFRSALSASPIAWPAQLDDKHRKVADDLAAKQGGDVDRDYIEAMVHGHQDFVARLESRLDLRTLADWKTAAAGRTQNKALPVPDVAMRDVQIRPERSDNAVTMKINQWAAETYPVAQKHLDTARALENATKKRTTH